MPSISSNVPLAGADSQRTSSILSIRGDRTCLSPLLMSDDVNKAGFVYFRLAVMIISDLTNFHGITLISLPFIYANIM